MFCLLIRFVIILFVGIHFVFLYLLSLYVLPLYTFCCYTFCLLTFFRYTFCFYTFCRYMFRHRTQCNIPGSLMIWWHVFLPLTLVVIPLFSMSSHGLRSHWTWQVRSHETWAWDSIPFLPFPPPQLSQGPRHSLYWHNKFKYWICCLPSWQLVIQIYLLFW
jgi:hypothetical protein